MAVDTIGTDDIRRNGRRVDNRTLRREVAGGENQRAGQTASPCPVLVT